MYNRVDVVLDRRPVEPAHHPINRMVRRRSSVLLRACRAWYVSYLVWENKDQDDAVYNIIMLCQREMSARSQSQVSLSRHLGRRCEYHLSTEGGSRSTGAVHLSSGVWS